MRFGTQLELGTYAPWKGYYIHYGRLKRLIKRKKFILDRKLESDAKSASGQGAAGAVKPSVKSPRQSPKSSALIQMTKTGKESFPLKLGGPPKDGYSKVEADDNEDFFDVILQEMEKINKFFTGKLAELRLGLDEITSKGFLPSFCFSTANYSHVQARDRTHTSVITPAESLI